MGVSSPSVVGVGGCCPGREGIAKEVFLCLKSGESPSFLSSEGKAIEGEGGITVTFRLDPPSEGTSSGTVFGERSTGVTQI